MLNIMDSQLNGMGASEMYRSWVFPELFPHEKPALLQNWNREDLEMYVGGIYTKGVA